MADFLVKKLSYLLRLTFICGKDDDFANNINHLLNLLLIINQLGLLWIECQG